MSCLTRLACLDCRPAGPWPQLKRVILVKSWSKRDSKTLQTSRVESSRRSRRISFGKHLFYKRALKNKWASEDEFVWNKANFRPQDKRNRTDMLSISWPTRCLFKHAFQIARFLRPIGLFRSGIQARIEIRCSLRSLRSLVKLFAHLFHFHGLYPRTDQQKINISSCES